MEADISQRELARRVIARTDGPNPGERRVENERRQIGRYLEGKHSPEPDRARLYAEILGKPADYFIDEQPSRTVDVLVELRGMVADLNRMIEGEGGDERPLAQIARLLGALEATVETQGAAMTKALGGVEERLERLEEGAASSAAPQAPKAPRARKAR